MPKKKQTDTEKGRGGRPPKFTSASQITEIVDQYFKDCEGTILYDEGKMVFDKYGQPIVLGKRPPTTTGLALALGFSDRRTLYNYRGKKEFKDVLAAAMTRIEMYAEERLYDREGANGAKFTLQNAFKGWNESEKEKANAVVQAVRILNDIPRELPEATQSEEDDVESDE